MSTASSAASFSPGVFAAHSFSAAAWIKEQRSRGTDLVVLRRDLAHHHRALNEELATLIQGELPHLVRLTKELSTSEDALRGLSQQIVDYQEGTRTITTEMDGRLNLFTAKLEERDQLETRLEQLRLLRRLAEVLGAVERLLESAPSEATLDCYATGEGTPRPLLSLLAEADTLLRAAGAFGQLRRLMRQGEALPLVRESRARVDAVRGLLVQRLQDCLGVSLEASCNAPVWCASAVPPCAACDCALAHSRACTWLPR